MGGGREGEEGNGGVPEKAGMDARWESLVQNWTLIKVMDT